MFEPTTRSRTVPDTSTCGRLGEIGDACADVDGDAREVVARKLAFAGVQPGPDVELERAGGVDRGERAADRTRGTVERGEHPVAGRADRATAVDRDLVVHEAIVVLDQVVPATVPKPRGVLGRADDVREHDRRQHSVGVVDSARAGHELLDLVEQRVGVAGEVDVVVAG